MEASISLLLSWRLVICGNTGNPSYGSSGANWISSGAPTGILLAPTGFFASGQLGILLVLQLGILLAPTGFFASGQLGIFLVVFLVSHPSDEVEFFCTVCTEFFENS